MFGNNPYSDLNKTSTAEKCSGSRQRVVAIWNEMTPYRAHILRRLAGELGNDACTHVFTQSVFNNSMPWTIEIPPGLDIRFDEQNRIPRGRFVHSGCFRLRAFILQVVAEVNPAFVIMHGHNDLTRLMLCRDLRRRRVPVVHASDSNVFGLRRGSLIRDVLRPLYHHMVLRGMNGFMPMGNAGRAYYHLIGGSSKPMFMFPYEPDYAVLDDVSSRQSEECLNRFGLVSSRRRFLYSGRLVPVKRVDVLITAFSRVAEHAPDWDLLIAGDGPLRGELESSVPAHLRHRVIFTGFQQLEELRSCYHVSHALVHPSEYEPWALVINEAAAAGLAIIATYVTGAALELVREGINGHLVTPGCAHSLEQAMLQVASGDTCLKYQQNSRVVLSEWIRCADPVEGFRKALRYFYEVGSAAQPSSRKS